MANEMSDKLRDEMGRNRPHAHVLPDDGTLTVRASAIADCPAALTMAALAASGLEEFGDLRPEPPPPWIQEHMDDSASLEAEALDLFADRMAIPRRLPRQKAEGLTRRGVASWHERFGHSLVGADWQDDGPNRLVTSGNTDGIMVWSEGASEQLVEIKVVGKGTFEYVHAVDVLNVGLPGLPDLLNKYIWQVSVYAHMGLPADARFRFEQRRRPMNLVFCEKDKGSLTGQMKVFSTFNGKLDLIPADSIREQLKLVHQLVKASLDSGMPPSCTGGSDWCQFSELHARPEIRPGKKLELLLALKEQRKKIELRIKDIDRQLIEEVQEVGGKAVTPDGTKLTYVTQHVKEKEPREYDRTFLKITPPKEKM